MDDITTYTFETSEIQCQVKYAINWTSLSIQAKAEFRPLTVTLDSSGSITWSQQTSRHDVTYDIIDNGKGLGDDVIIRLILKETQCTDGNTFMCYLKSPLKEDQTHSIMVVVGKPDGKVKLTLGPAVVEDRALRITASWQGGFPVPWTNMSWMAIDMDNKTYDLSVYGQYTDYELTKDDRKCQTFMQHSIVIFPRLHLNATTVIVKPNLSMKKYFVDKVMEDYLATVKPGVERILVIPLSYCPSNAKDMSIPHPYTPCNKFVRCHSGDLAVQLCPTGTCFYEPTGECVSIYR
ncbi:uncharacterized protein LOC127835516 [Dreissena polymorpha]|uniref:uncharacterized protein LOC127835516 n=1 Tax=Dreissena polymorpha TaxID=45954 RepID=UPI002263EC20|nr:uncharacterized protein LOC127835516 [Dreissena polymorpha]